MSLANAQKVGATIDLTSNKVKTSSTIKKNSSSSGGNANVKTKQQLAEEEWERNRKANEEKAKTPSGTIDIYRPDTRTQAQKDEIAKLERSSARNKFIDKYIKEPYDKTIGQLFSGVNEVVVGGYQKGKKKAEKDVYGNWGMEEIKDYSYGGGQGTIISKGFEKLSEEELLKKSPYMATEIVGNRKSVELQEKAVKESQKIQEEIQKKLEKENLDYQEKRREFWQNQINAGWDYDSANENFIKDATNFAERSTELANKEANNQFEKYITPEIEKTQNYLEEFDKKAGRKRAKSEMGARFISGAIIGGGMALTGGVGLAIGGLSLGRTALDSKNIVKAFKNDPVKFGMEVIPQVLGGIAGYKGVQALRGQGNIRLANKISKVPKELEMKGVVNYLRHMKSMPINKLRKIVGPEGKVVVKGKGGVMTITRSGKGILKATREGKNWHETITLGADDVVRGVIKRSFRNKLGKNVEYSIKYKIMSNGNRITEYFKGAKKFSTIKDTIKPQYVIGKEIQMKGYPVKAKKFYSLTKEGKKVGHLADDLDDSQYYLGEDGNWYSGKELNSMRSVRDTQSYNLKTQSIKGIGKSKYSTKGDIQNVYASKELVVADPVEFNTMMKIAVKNGNKKQIAFLKAVQKQRAIISDGKGINKDLLKYGKVKTIYDPQGNIVKLQMLKEFKTPKLEIVSHNLKKSEFYVKQTRNPSAVIKAINKLDKALTEDAINSGRIYMNVDPVSGLVLKGASKLKMPQLRVKTQALDIKHSVLGGKFGRIMALPKDLSLEQLKYLIGVGAVDVKSILDVLKNKNNLTIKTLPISLNRLNNLNKLANLQRSAQASATAQLSTNSLQSPSVQVENPSINPRMPEVPIPGMTPINPIILPEDDFILKDGKKIKFDVDVFKQLRYNDPLEMLAGRKKYSDKMNIQLTRRYGNLYS